MEENRSKSDLEGWREEEGVEIVGKMAAFDAIREEINGGVDLEEVSELNVKIGEEETLKVNGDGVGEEKVNGDVVGEGTESIGSPQVAAKTNGEGTMETCESESLKLGSSSPAVVKGYGLKKWRRIRRDSNKDGSAGADSSVIHKRRFSVNEPPKARDEIKVKDDVEVVVEVEVEAPTQSIGSTRSVEAAEVAPMDPELVNLATSFSIGMDSDNSEERSSKSSSAASVLKPRHEIGFGRERARLLKGLGGRGAGNMPQQRGQRGKGVCLDANKKSRGDRTRLEKETTQSSIDLDLRSSNMEFSRRGSGVSNGKQSENSQNFDAEYSDDYEAQMCEEVRSVYYKENGRVEDLPREDFDVDLLEKETNGTGGKFRPPSGIDPFIESIVLLQTAQEALELEIHKIGEIGKEATIDGQCEETEVSSSPAFEANLVESSREIERLQHKLEAAVATGKAKESKVLELEAIINRTQSPKNETCSTRPPLNEMHQKLESELESLLKKKIEAEIEFLIITRTTQSWKVVTEDQIALLQEQKSLAGDQAQMALKLKEAETKALKVNDRADELGDYCKELLQTEKTLKLQNKVCKFSVFFFLQLLLLCIAFGLFLIQVLPQPNDVVPT